MNSESRSSDRPSVTEWLDSVKRGSDSAAHRIWERYVEQLVREADHRLKNLPRRKADGEDIAQEAFACFFRGIHEGRFSRLDDRDDLWQLLIMLADRRAKDYLRHELAQRRGGGQVRGNSGIQSPAEESELGGNAFDSLAGPPPTPESAEQLLRVIQVGFPVLADNQLQEIALDRAANYSDVEIAQRHGISLRGAQRKLKLIRSLLKREAGREA